MPELFWEKQKSLNSHWRHRYDHDLFRLPPNSMHDCLWVTQQGHNSPTIQGIKAWGCCKRRMWLLRVVPCSNQRFYTYICRSAMPNTSSVLDAWSLPLNSTIWSTPGYSGISKSYFLATDDGRNLQSSEPRSQKGGFGLRSCASYLPPTKCIPLKCLTSGFGAVKLIKVAGWNFAPGPDEGGPCSILHDEGASTESTGTPVFSIAPMTVLNGSRTSPEKLKPKIVSTTWCESSREDSKSSVKGISRFRSCVARRS